MTADMWNPDCADCKRLRRDYIAAIMEHVKLENSFRIATLQHNRATAAALRIDVEIAAGERFRLRELVLRHKVHGHAAAAGRP
jgi:hypothetical protein